MTDRAIFFNGNIFIKVAAVCFLLLFSGLSHAAEIKGEIKQGGIILGKTAPDTEVYLNDKKLRVSKNGYFVFGMGRNAKKTAELIEKPKNGKKKTTSLVVKTIEWEVQKINGLPKKQVSPDKKTLERIFKEIDIIKKVRKKDTETPYFLKGFIQPVEGRISGVFGSQRILNGEPRSPHSGIDIAAPAGTPVKASCDGIVSLVHEDMFYTGKTVMIDHGHTLETIYVHLKEIAVKLGDSVKQGDIIGYVGSTGRATGPHLHWGLSWGGVKLDPDTVKVINWSF